MLSQNISVFYIYNINKIKVHVSDVVHLMRWYIDDL